MMNYLGFLSFGVGILTLVTGMIIFAVSIFSHEKNIQQKTRQIAIIMLPVALLLIMTGFGLTYHILFPSEHI